MSFLRRRSPTPTIATATFAGHRIVPDGTQPAVPLTPEDTQVLVTGFIEDDRLLRLRRTEIDSGLAVARGMAAEVMRAAALAADLGHQTVPMPCRNLHEIALTRDVLVRRAFQAASTRQFETLELKLQALSALSARRRWLCTYDGDARCDRWVTPVTMPDLGTTLQIGP